MNRIAEAIQQVGRATGNDKLVMLKRNEAVPGFKEVLRFIYNPYCKTGIGAAKLANAKDAQRGLSPVLTWQEAIKYFSTHQTGSDSDVAYATEFILQAGHEYGADAMRLAHAMVTQDLKIGVSVTSLNKVFGTDFIPKTGCMLGTLFGDVNPANIHWPCIVTEKLDGVRRILVKENGVCHFYSRSGHPDEGLVDILEEAKYLPDNYMYDGELLAISEFKDSIAQRQATNSIANSKGRKTGLSFNIFDMVPVDEFYKGVSKDNAVTRKILLGATLKDEGIRHIDDAWSSRMLAFGIEQDLKYIKPVPVLGLVNSLSAAEPIVNEIWKRGGEGIMLNTTDGLYEIKRSKRLLKVKHTEEYIVTCVDVQEGTGKYEDSMGALVVLYTNNKGQKAYLGVGSGFTDDQRRHIWDNPDLYIGRQLEIETFGESVNAQGYLSLNCPIFKRFVGEAE